MNNNREVVQVILLFLAPLHLVHLHLHPLHLLLLLLLMQVVVLTTRSNGLNTTAVLGR